MGAGPPAAPGPPLSSRPRAVLCGPCALAAPTRESLPPPRRRRWRRLRCRRLRRRGRAAAAWGSRSPRSTGRSTGSRRAPRRPWSACGSSARVSARGDPPARDAIAAPGRARARRTARVTAGARHQALTRAVPRSLWYSGQAWERAPTRSPASVAFRCARPSASAASALRSRRASRASTRMCRWRSAPAAPSTMRRVAACTARSASCDMRPPTRRSRSRMRRCCACRSLRSAPPSARRRSAARVQLWAPFGRTRARPGTYSCWLVRATKVSGARARARASAASDTPRTAIAPAATLTRVALPHDSRVERVDHLRGCQSHHRRARVLSIPDGLRAQGAAPRWGARSGYEHGAARCREGAPRGGCESARARVSQHGRAHARRWAHVGRRGCFEGGRPRSRGRDTRPGHRDGVRHHLSLALVALLRRGAAHGSSRALVAPPGRHGPGR